MISLSNKTILVTGASSGIGKETAILLSKLGARVIITARRENLLKETLSLMNKNEHLVLPCDATKEEQVKNLITQIPSIDGWLHATGKVFPMPIKFIQKKHIDDVFAVNYLSAVNFTTELLTQRKLNNHSSIIFISSISTIHSYFGGALYTSSKAALESFAKTLALELAPKKIRVNVLQPALVKTDIYQSTLEAAVSEEEMKKYESQYPLGIGEPIDIASISAFLLSDYAKWITGTFIKMDGGLSLGLNKS
jgi:NAD(P)-dependent dehydrogenase (short-subunit alcohol dehydrogenase family)